MSVDARSASLSLSLVVVIAALSMGCSAATRLVAPSDDYADYRKVRLAPLMGARLRAARDYLQARPNGVFAPEVRRLFEDEEPTFFDLAKESRAGTLEYLTYLQDGPHAGAAASLLVAWDTKIEEGENAALLRAARRTEALLGASAVQRQQVGDTLFVALRALSDPGVYGVRLTETPATLRRFLSGGEGPTWGAMPSRTIRDLFFVVPTQLERESRFATLIVSLDMDHEVVRAGRVMGPDLFVHWLEADAMIALDPTDRRARARGVRHARERLEGFFEALLPKARCTKPEDAGAPPQDPSLILQRACDGWTLEVRAGSNAGEDDVITLQRRP